MSDRPIELNAPMMGDLIYFPVSKGLFEIKYVDNKQTFFQGGKLYTYKLECELFKYSMEEIETGNSEIDKIMSNIVVGVDENGDNIDDFIQDSKGPNESTKIQTDGAVILDFSENDPFSSGNY